MPVIDQQAGTARDLLREHVVGALRDVRAAREGLDHAPAVADMGDRSLFDFDDALEQHHAGLVAVLESVDAGDPLDDCRAEFRRIAERLRQALGECFAYVHGAVARSAGFGTRLCALADGLLDDLAERTPAGWGRLTVLAEGEFMGDLAGIVRLRFPESSVWSLPIAAHELGHYVMPRLGRTLRDGTLDFPVRDMLEAVESQGPGAESRLHEHLADAFATYATGPALAFASIVLRFDPAGGGSDWRHPSDDSRVRSMIRMLELMDAESGEYALPIARLRALWATAPPAPESAKAEALAEQLHALLERRSSAVRHGGFGEPLRIASALRRAWERSEPMPAVALRRPWDAINAIWWARVDWPATAPYVLNDLADFAAKACWTALGRARPLPPVDWGDGA